MAQIKLRDQEGIGVPLVNIRLGINGQNVDEAYDDKFTEPDSGTTAWPNPLPSSAGYDLFVNYVHKLDDYESKTVHVENFDNDIIIELIELSPSIESLERITVDGLYFNKFIKGESAFLDYYRFLLEQDITPLLQQSRDLGSNCRRNFLMTYNTAKAAGLLPFNPDDFGNKFYDSFPYFLALYEEHGLYLYASCFPDNGLFPSWANNNSKQVDHWNKICEIGKNHNNFFAVELTNEPGGHSFNQVDTDKFSQPNGIISCSGSYGPTGGNSMPGPKWSMRDFHTPRQYPNLVVDCCVANHPNRLMGEPVLIGEPLGFGPNREKDPRIAKEMAGTARGTAAGITFHSTHGGFSQLYDNDEMSCGEAWFKELEEK